MRCRHGSSVLYYRAGDWSGLVWSGLSQSRKGGGSTDNMTAAPALNLTAWAHCHTLGLTGIAHKLRTIKRRVPKNTAVIGARRAYRPGSFGASSRHPSPPGRQAHEDHENLAAPSPCPLVPVEPSPSTDKLGVRPAIERPEQHPPVRSCGFDPTSPTGSALALRAYCLIGFSAERRTCIVGGRPRGHNETAKPFLDHAMDWSDTARAQAAQRWRHAATPAKRE